MKARLKGYEQTDDRMDDFKLTYNFKPITWDSHNNYVFYMLF